MALLKNSLLVSVWTAASRGLGFARDLLIANKLGASMASDAFFVALMLPNLLRRVLGEGAFNVAFVPLLAKEKAKSTEAAIEFASSAFTWLLLIATALTVAGTLAMPLIVPTLMPGWANEPEKLALTIFLGRLTFPYLALITIAAFLGAMCNTWGKFAAYAMVPALLNISILLCLFALPSTGMDPATAAALSVPLGGIAQAAYMIYSARKLGIRLRLTWPPKKHPKLKTLLLRLGPATLGVGVLQLSLLTDNFIASFLEGTVITYLQMANRFYQLPLSLIGIAVATVLLPHLAGKLGEGKNKDAGDSFIAAFTTCITLSIGAAVGLMFLSYPLFATFFAHGAFTHVAAYATSWAMVGFVAGLPGYIITKVTAPAFFANEDPLTPVKASAISLLVNLVANITCLLVAHQFGVSKWAYVGIALSTALGGYTNAYLQIRWLKQKGFLTINWADLTTSLTKWALLTAAMAATGSLTWLLLPFNSNWVLMGGLAWLALAGSVLGATFIILSETLNLLQIKALLTQLRRRKKVKTTP
ncbi:MAG: murein biosynthesis integral membrane protein MurJ [Alphaproteobacteria bacterium CG_4_10_14_0_8_um_filter_53_9]|nr:MAG: murein biosynthesis integral membrane protein MurJ [Alphaproteobacteria bacterium CG_4_10_14_0_8_um_filter_53_9]